MTDADPTHRTVRPDRILVLKFGGLGDVVLSFAAIARIRAAHPGAELTVLTTPPYAELFGACPDVDRVESDGRPRSVMGSWALIKRLRRERYGRVYDLQTSRRSSRLFYWLLPSPPEWSGIAIGASHRHQNPRRNFMHSLEQKAEQLRDAGIWPDAPTAPGTAPPPDLSWILNGARLRWQPEKWGLVEPFCLLVPGSSARRSDKRWPADRFAELAQWLNARKFCVGVVGGAAEMEIADKIPFARNLVGKTDLLDLAVLGAKAVLVVGNDTGPSHLLAAAGAPTLVLFSQASDPALHVPRGRKVATLRQGKLAHLPVESVAAAVEDLLRR